YAYIWGDVLKTIKDADIRIINLETSITRSNAYADKGINYKMHPENIPCLSMVKIDCCVLANNHVLDWGQEGLFETLETLEEVGIDYCGAGRNIDQGKAPSILRRKGNSRVLVFSFGLNSSGIPHNWKATKSKAGVNLLDDLSIETVKYINREITQYKQPYDVVVASIHWGSNWGYSIPNSHRDFAHNLIDLSGVDIIHGHSSHHPLGIEIYKNKPIIYGCGDFLNDYEGIRGHESYKANLGFMYFVTIDTANGHLVSLRLVPTEIKKLRIGYPSNKNRRWLYRISNREGAQFGTKILWRDKSTLDLTWN
ncbi:MAG: CapA family protein, partial [Maribacter sp.]|nr:CapA family protein [Maribacter sp.]